MRFVWDQAHGMRNLQSILVNDFGLDLTGWKLATATGVSGDGKQIVGFGTDPQGNHEAWIADLSAPAAAVPEPSSLIAWSVLGLIVSQRTWRRR